MTFVVEPVPTPTLRIDDSNELFPVRHVYCVGRNYADHAMEMGGDPDREPPFFFMKADYAVTQADDVEYPGGTEDVHHEVELVIAIGRAGRHVALEHADQYVYGYAVGVDLTRRDLQQQAKDLGRPWEAGKNFVQAAPCSNVKPALGVGLIQEATIALRINDEMRQSGNVNQMIWKIDEIIVRVSELFSLEPGDLIFTGTPAGVGKLVSGDVVAASIEGIGTLEFTVG